MEKLLLYIYIVFFILILLIIVEQYYLNRNVIFRNVFIKCSYGKSDYFFLAIFYSIIYFIIMISLFYFRFLTSYNNYVLNLKQYFKQIYFYNSKLLFVLIIIIFIIFILILIVCINFFVKQLKYFHHILVFSSILYNKWVVFILKYTNWYCLYFLILLKRKKYSNIKIYKRIYYSLFSVYLFGLYFHILVLVSIFIFDIVFNNFCIYLFFKILPYVLIFNLLIRIVYFYNYESLKKTGWLNDF